MRNNHRPDKPLEHLLLKGGCCGDSGTKCEGLKIRLSFKGRVTKGKNFIWVLLIVTFFDHQGVLRTYSSPGSSLCSLCPLQRERLPNYCATGQACPIQSRREIGSHVQQHRRPDDAAYLSDLHLNPLTVKVCLFVGIV